MKLRKLELENWCQHGHLVAEFGNGLIGCLGSNGKGKSNIFRAVVYALTGYTSSPKNLYVKYGATKGSVSLEFYGDNSSVLYKVVRGIPGSDVAVSRFDGDKFVSLASKTADARKLLSEIVQLTPDMAQQIFATPQEDMTALFSATAQTRMDVLQKVFSLSFFDRIRSHLGEILHDAELQTACLQSTHTLLEDQLYEAKLLLEKWSDLPDLQELQKESARLSSELQSVNVELKSLKWKEFLDGQVAKNTALISKLQVDLLEPSIVVPAGWESRESTDTRLTWEYGDSSVIARLIKELTNLKIPGNQPVSDSDLDELRRQAEVTAAEKTKAHDLYQRIKKAGTTGVCPLCGGPVSYTQEDLHTAKADYDKKSADSDMAQQRCNTASTQYQQWIYAVRQEQSVINNGIATLAGLHNPVEISSEGMTAQRLLQYCQTLKVTRDQNVKVLRKEQQLNQEYQNAVTEWHNRRESLARQLAAANDELKSATESLQGLKLSDKPESELLVEQERLTRLQNQNSELLIRSTQQQAVQAQVAKLTASLEDAENQLKASNPEYQEKLSRMRGYFRPSNFPQQVARRIYALLTKRMEKYLTEFDAPYTVSLTETGGFLCKMKSGLEQTSDRLSGGEKMVLSIAFRLALHSVFSSSDVSGFIMLDEPTTFLDEKNKESLVKLLHTLMSSPMFSELQVFVVTHDDSLRPLFSNIIDLGV